MSDAYLNAMPGQQFGHLTALAPPERGGKNRPRMLLARCVCGAEVRRRLAEVLSGHTSSCGCRRKDLVRASVQTHGKHQSPEYRSWQMMLQRCTNPEFTSFKNYGAKGVAVCARWAHSFEAFLADMGPRPQGTTLDRWPNRKGNYEPGNCRWATRAEQSQNTSANCLTPELVREIRTSRENCNRIAKRLGVSPSTIYNARAGTTWANVEEAAA